MSLNETVNQDIKSMILECRYILHEIHNKSEVVRSVNYPYDVGLTKLRVLEP